MLAPLLASPLLGSPEPGLASYPTSFFDDRPLDVFLSQMVATELTMQSPSPDTIDWISESPSPTLHHDSGNYFHTPMFNADQLMMTFPDNQLHKGLVSDPSDDLRQRISNPGCHGVLPSVDSPWSTHSQDLPGLGEVIASQFAPSQCQNTARSYFVDVSAEEPTKPSHIKPTCLFPEYNGMIDTTTTTTTVNGVHDPSYRRDARAMRECLMLQAADGKPLNEAFRKSAKDIVATPNTRMASSARRKYPPKYSCPIEGCSGDFTRKHNLDNHLRSHCGITDLICNVCHQGFTTIPVWKRHKKSCRHPSTA